MKKILTYSVVFLVIAVPHVLLAQVVITEIMYDPVGTDSGHEWIEVYNSGATSILLTSWKISEGGANHNIIAASGDKSLAPASYAVIAQNAAKFAVDHPAYSSELFHSAFSLDNAGTTIELRNASSTIIESVSYDSSSGALGDGNSLQRPPDDNAQFSPHVPTPGASMSSDVVSAKTAAPPASAKTSGKSSKNSTNSSEVKPQKVADPKEIIAPTSVVAAVASPAHDDIYWWLAVLAFILVAIGTILAAKYFKSGEWDIVEEKPEDV